MTANGVLVLAGPPCAGKSSAAALLASGTSGGRRIRIEVDSLFSLLFPSSDRNRTDRMLAYDAAHEIARMLTGRGHTPMLECTYSRSEQRASLLTATAGIPAAPLWVVEFGVRPDDPAEQIATWLRGRPRPVDQARWAAAGNGWD